MRLVCREDHDEPEERCPPHEFTASWDKDTDGNGVIYCTACGDVRPLSPPNIGAPVEESVAVEHESR